MSSLGLWFGSHLDITLLYVCMYVCMYVCVYVCMYVCIHLGGDEHRTFTKGLKRIGTNQGLPPANWGGGGGGTHIHALLAGGRFGTSVE